MSVSCRLVARELMLPAPGSSWFGEGGENGAVRKSVVHLDVVRLVRVVVKAHDREVNDKLSDVITISVSPFVASHVLRESQVGGSRDNFHTRIPAETHWDPSPTYPPSN